MPFSDAFQSYSHYQNSSYKKSPVQRDASSRNDEIYAAARRQREASANGKNAKTADGSYGTGSEVEGEGAMEWRHDLGSPTMTAKAGQEGTEYEGKPLPDFETDDRGNVYLKSSGSGSGWWKKAKGAFRKKPAEADVVR